MDNTWNNNLPLWQRARSTRISRAGAAIVVVYRRRVIWDACNCFCLVYFRWILYSLKARMMVIRFSSAQFLHLHTHLCGGSPVYVNCTQGVGTISTDDGLTYRILQVIPVRRTSVTCFGCVVFRADLVKQFTILRWLSLL